MKCRLSLLLKQFFQDVSFLVMVIEMQKLFSLAKLQGRKRRSQHAHSVEEALRIARDHGETEAFIIGGGEIYRQSMPWWDRLYLTRVDAAIEGGDAFFPQIDIDEWEIVSSEPFPPDEKNEFGYTFLKMERR